MSTANNRRLQTVQLGTPSPKQDMFLRCHKKFIGYGGARGGWQVVGGESQGNSISATIPRNSYAHRPENIQRVGRKPHPDTESHDA